MTVARPLDFATAFQLVVGHEGGFQRHAWDDGNWTGGRQGRGELKGTKYGISAASYPDLDIEGLTLEQAAAVYRRDYWDGLGGDHLPWPVAYLAFDVAVLHGLGDAARMLQRAVGAVPDGVVGPKTRAAVEAAWRADAAGLLTRLAAARLIDLSESRRWPEARAGWIKRAALAQTQALQAQALQGQVGRL